MTVRDLPGVWALGDNAAVPNAAANGEYSPPTAQYALRQGKRLGDNLAAVLRGQVQNMKPFDFPGLGQLCLVGHRAGVAELPAGIKLSGFIAWVMWRNIYLSKLPGWDRKVRVGLDWSLDLIFPRELSQLSLGRTQVVNQAHYEPGDIIFRQGDVGDIFYVIQSGEVEVFKELSNGQQVPLTRLGQGEHFGESALISGRRRNATVRALGPVDLMCLGRDEFNNLAGAWLKFSESVQALSNENSRVFNGSNIESSRDFRTILGTMVLGPQLAGLIPPREPENIAPPPAPATPSQPVPPPAAPVPAPSPQMYMPPPPPSLIRSDGAELMLEGDMLTLGRAPDNHIIVDDKQVSRRHAVIKREAGGYILEDVGTANGTFVNGQRIQRHLLTEGDTITLGRFSYTYRAAVAPRK